MPTWPSSSTARSIAWLLLIDLVVRPDHLGDLPADLVQRVQAGERVLEDHGDFLAADLLHLPCAEADEVDPVEHRRARDLPAWGQAEQALGEYCLAAAGFADDSERPATFNVE